MHVEPLGLATDLALLELQGSTIRDRGDHLVVHTPADPDYWWGNFLVLGAAVGADEIPHWLAEFEAELPGMRHRTFAFTDATGDYTGWAERGFAVETDVALSIRQVPAWAPVDRSVAIRHLATRLDWQHAAELGASDVPMPRLGARLRFEQHRAIVQKSLVDDGRAAWFGAFIGDRLVGKLGIVLIGSRARFQDVITHAAYRRRGIAAGLARIAGEWALTQPDIHELVIVAAQGGPAEGLYERLGFEEVGRHVAVELAP